VSQIVEFSLDNTLDVTGAGYEYDFTWLYTLGLETGYSMLLYSERIQHRSASVANLSPGKLNV